MSTSAHIAIKVNGRFAHVRVNFDGYPSHMLKVIANLTDEQILAAREIRSISDAGEIESYADANAGEVTLSPALLETYTYYRDASGAWVYLS